MKKRYKDYTEIMKDYGDDIFIIEYPFRWGGQFADKSFWCALDMKNGEAYDYHTKEHLKKDLSEHRYKWIVVRHHLKNKGISVLEQSPTSQTKISNEIFPNGEHNMDLEDSSTKNPKLPSATSLNFELCSIN